MIRMRVYSEVAMCWSLAYERRRKARVKRARASEALHMKTVTSNVFTKAMEHLRLSHHLVEHRFLLVVLDGAFTCMQLWNYSNSSLYGVTQFDRDPVGRAKTP